MKIQDLLKQAKPCWKYAVFNSNLYPRGWIICKNKPFIQSSGWFTNNAYFKISDLFEVEPFDGDWKNSLICREEYFKDDK